MQKWFVQKIYRIEDLFLPIVMIIYRKVTGIFIQTFLFGYSMLMLILGESTITLGQLDTAENKPPVIVVPSSINAEINQAVVINTSISDPDGNITSVIWNQEHEFGPVNMNIADDKRSMSFIPVNNVTYVFSVEAIDNNGLTALESVRVNVGEQ